MLFVSLKLHQDYFSANFPIFFLKKIGNTANCLDLIEMLWASTICQDIFARNSGVRNFRTFTIPVRYRFCFEDSLWYPWHMYPWGNTEGPHETLLGMGGSTEVQQLKNKYEV